MLLFFVSFNGFSQQVQAPFLDAEPKPDSYVISVIHEGSFAYMAGSSSNTCGVVPFISKISLETGETRWNTIQTLDESYELPHAISKIEVIGDAVFGVSRAFYQFDQPEFWKVNKTTGALEWKIYLPDATSMSSISIHAYSSTQVILYLDYAIYLVNIASGVIEKSQADGGGQFMGVGIDQVIYFGYKKIVNFDFLNSTSSIPFPPGMNCFSGKPYPEVYQISTTKLLGFAQKGCDEKGVFLIDLPTNQIVWSLTSSSQYMNEFKVKGNYLYVAWGPLFLGESFASASKINITNGNVEWRSNNLYATDHDTEHPYSQHVTSGRALSIDVDDLGDVYLTGSANGQSNTGDMGIMKLSGANGAKLFEKIITENENDYDDYSWGVKVIVQNGIPYFIGNVTEEAYYNFQTPTGYGISGNNMVLVKLDPSTGNLLSRNNYNGGKVDPSLIKQILSYKNEDLLILENRGRHAFISRYDKNLNVIWSRKLRYKNFYGHEAMNMALDNAGNIAITAIGSFLSNRSDIYKAYEKSIVFVLDENGQTLQEVKLSYGLRAINDLHSDGNNFFVLSGDDSRTIIYKLNTTGLIAERELNFHHTTGNATTRRMCSKSGDELIILGGYSLKMLVVNKTTLSYQESPVDLTDDPNNPNPYDMIIRNDTLYTVNFDPHGDSFRNMTCYSFVSNTVVWSGTRIGYNYGNRFQKIIFDDKGNLYALGTGQYQGFLLQRLDRKTGIVRWSQLRTYSQDIEASNLFYDKIRNEIVVTGHKTAAGGNQYTTAMFNADTGSPVLVETQATAIGSGLVIGQAGNGDIITGGILTPNDQCTSSSVLMRHFSSLLSTENLSASDGLENQVTVSWTTKSTNAFFKLYRSNTNNAATAVAISGWIQTTTFSDGTAQPATGYYYFIKAAKDNIGTASSKLSQGDYGYRSVPRPVLNSVQVATANTLYVTWMPSAGASFYRVFRGATIDPAQAEGITSWLSSTTYTDTNVMPGRNYYYFIQAALNGSGDFSSSLSDGKDGMISLPTTEVVTATEGIENFVSVSWTTLSTNAFFKVYRNTVNIASSALPVSEWISTMSYNDPTALIATGYYYFVQVASGNTGAGASELSTGDFGYRGIARPVLNTVSTTESNSLTVMWTPSVGASFYRLYRGSDSNASHAVAITSWISSNDYTDADVSAGTTYFYFVQASLNSGGDFATLLSDGLSGATNNILGTEPKSALSSFQVYPNPMNERVTVAYSSDYVGSITISLVDAIGNLIMETTESKSTYYFEKVYDLSSLRTGFMFMLVKEPNVQLKKKLLKH